MKSCVCLEIFVVYRFFKGGLAVWWKKMKKKKEIENVMNEFQKLKMHDLLVSFSKWHFLTLFKKKNTFKIHHTIHKYSEPSDFSDEKRRSFFVKEAFIERLNKCIDAVKPIECTKYFFLQVLNIFMGFY